MEGNHYAPAQPGRAACFRLKCITRWLCSCLHLTLNHVAGGRDVLPADSAPAPCSPLISVSTEIGDERGRRIVFCCHILPYVGIQCRFLCTISMSTPRGPPGLAYGVASAGRVQRLVELLPRVDAWMNCWNDERGQVGAASSFSGLNRQLRRKCLLQGQASSVAR